MKTQSLYQIYLAKDANGTGEKSKEVLLSPEEFAVLEQFVAHYDVFVGLLEGGVLGMKNGSAALHFDSEGILRGIKKEFWSYKLTKGTELL